MTDPFTSASGKFVFNGTYPIFENKIIEFKIEATDNSSLVGSASFFVESKRKYNE